ncbi:MAG TPA: glycosyltransferase family 2 protein [Acidobacteriaceae bacterium]|jgi:undecaprenyl-phosphate 4-deoxy-4-formamido-L-arabinose transferase
MTDHSVSVVVPVYNAESSLRELIDRLTAVFHEGGARAEFILVNDGSSDASWAMIESLAASNQDVRGIDLMRNFGQHNALLCGIRSARHEVIVTLDDDLQNPPEEIPKLLRRLSEGYDVVYGTPLKEAHGLLRDCASKVTKLALQSAMGADNARNVSAFRAFRTNLRRAFEDFKGPNASIDVLLTWGTKRFSAVKVRVDPRAYGKSNYTLSKLVSHAFTMMTGFSVLPLQFASIVGFAFTVLGISTLVFVVIRYLIAGDQVPGFPFLASMIAVFAGVQLFALGVIGEYLGRIHFRMMDRPTYAIKANAERQAALEN